MAGTPSYKAYPAWTEVQDIQRGNGLSEWLRVPWTETWVNSFAVGTSSATNVDVTGGNVYTFRKLRDSSRLIVDITAGLYASVAACTATTVFSVNGTDYDVGFLLIPTINAHTQVRGMAEIDGLPAGVYTGKIRWRTSNSIVTDGNDRWWVSVTETNSPPSL